MSRIKVDISSVLSASAKSGGKIGSYPKKIEQAIALTVAVGRLCNNLGYVCISSPIYSVPLLPCFYSSIKSTSTIRIGRHGAYWRARR